MANNQTKKYQAGYRSLLVYKLAQAIYDLTPQFIERYLNKFSRNPDQVDQAARSGLTEELYRNRKAYRGY